jgi:hypothetical protein
LSATAWTGFGGANSGVSGVAAASAENNPMPPALVAATT